MTDWQVPRLKGTVNILVDFSALIACPGMRTAVRQGFLKANKVMVAGSCLPGIPEFLNVPEVFIDF